MLVVFMLLFYCVGNAQAGVDVSSTLGYSQGVESDSGPYFKMTITEEDKPYYLWASNESTTTRLLGQPLADTSIWGVGFGYKDYFTEKGYWFGEIGYAYLDHDVSEVIRQEIIYTELVNRHARVNRPVPIGELPDRLLTPMGPYSQDTYTTVWETKGAVIGAVGLGYSLNKHLDFIINYRPLFVKEHMELRDNDPKVAEGGWWQESRKRDYSTIQVGVKWNF